MTSDSYRVALLDTDAPPETVFETAVADEAIEWAKEWLNDPLGLPVVVYPPGVEIPVAA